MPGIPYAIEAETLLWLGRDRDPWQRQPPPQQQRHQRLDHQRSPLLPVNCQFEIPPKTPSKSTTTVHDSSMNSNGSENDLAAMVHDFMENGDDGYDSSDKESAAPTGFAVFFEKLKALVSAATPVEKDLRSAVIRILTSMSEDRIDGFCHRGIDCKGRCLRSVLVKRLRKCGYDAGICCSRWQSVGRVPGGEYEYIDVEVGGQRLVVELDFQSHFEIARPIQSYKAAVRSLPSPFVGSTRRLRQVLEVMSDAAKFSLRQNAMHLPPWRTFGYVSAKWFSPYDRDAGLAASAAAASDGSSAKNNDVYPTGDNNGLVAPLAAGRKRCCEQLKRTKLAMRQECLPPAAQAQSRGRPPPAAAAAAEYQR